MTRNNGTVLHPCHSDTTAPQTCPTHLRRCPIGPRRTPHDAIGPLVRKRNRDPLLANWVFVLAQSVVAVGENETWKPYYGGWGEEWQVEAGRSFLASQRRQMLFLGPLWCLTGDRDGFGIATVETQSEMETGLRWRITDTTCKCRHTYSLQLKAAYLKPDWNTHVAFVGRRDCESAKSGARPCFTFCHQTGKNPIDENESVHFFRLHPQRLFTRVFETGRV